MRRSTRLVCALLALTLLTACQTDPGTKLPAPLPELRLASFDKSGEPLEFADVRRPTVVTFWAWWCTQCRRELPRFEEFYQRHGDDVDVLGIDWQETNVAKARGLIRRSGVTFPLYADPGGDTNALDPFPVMRGLPLLVLVGGDGEVVHQEFVYIDSVDQLEELVRKHLEVDL